MQYTYNPHSGYMVRPNYARMRPRYAATRIGGYASAYDPQRARDNPALMASSQVAVGPRGERFTHPDVDQISDQIDARKQFVRDLGTAQSAEAQDAMRRQQAAQKRYGEVYHHRQRNEALFAGAQEVNREKREATKERALARHHELTLQDNEVQNDLMVNEQDAELRMLMQQDATFTQQLQALSQQKGRFDPEAANRFKELTASLALVDQKSQSGEFTLKDRLYFRQQAANALRGYAWGEHVIPVGQKPGDIITQGIYKYMKGSEPGDPLTLLGYADKDEQGRPVTDEMKASDWHSNTFWDDRLGALMARDWARGGKPYVVGTRSTSSSGSRSSGGGAASLEGLSFKDRIALEKGARELLTTDIGAPPPTQAQIESKMRELLGRPSLRDRYREWKDSHDTQWPAGLGGESSSFPPADTISDEELSQWARETGQMPSPMPGQGGMPPGTPPGTPAPSPTSGITHPAQPPGSAPPFAGSGQAPSGMRVSGLPSSFQMGVGSSHGGPMRGGIPPLSPPPPGWPGTNMHGIATVSPARAPARVGIGPAIPKVASVPKVSAGRGGAATVADQRKWDHIQGLLAQGASIPKDTPDRDLIKGAIVKTTALVAKGRDKWTAQDKKDYEGTKSILLKYSASQGSQQAQAMLQNDDFVEQTTNAILNGKSNPMSIQRAAGYVKEVAPKVGPEFADELIGRVAERVIERDPKNAHRLIREFDEKYNAPVRVRDGQGNVVAGPADQPASLQQPPAMPAPSRSAPAALGGQDSWQNLPPNVQAASKVPAKPIEETEEYKAAFGGLPGGQPRVSAEEARKLFETGRLLAPKAEPAPNDQGSLKDGSLYRVKDSLGQKDRWYIGRWNASRKQFEVLGIVEDEGGVAPPAARKQRSKLPKPPLGHPLYSY